MERDFIIYGEKYTLKFKEGQSSEEVEKAVHYLNQKIDYFREKYPLYSSKKLLILIALNIIDEFNYYRNNNQDQAGDNKVLYQALSQIKNYLD